jgi:hypothetical protein
MIFLLDLVGALPRLWAWQYKFPAFSATPAD